MDQTDPTTSDLAKEMKDDMFGFATGFVARMCKRVASS